MIKSIDLAKKIVKHIDKDHSDLLFDLNLHNTFSPLKNYSTVLTNQIIAYIIFAYDNDSPWLNLKQDRIENKLKIISGIGADKDSSTFKDILDSQNDTVLDIINTYLQEQTTWKWGHITTLLDYHSSTMRFISKKTETEKTFDKQNKEGGVETLTEDYDIDKITKVQQQKGVLASQALAQRREADQLLLEIKKEFVQVDAATNADFGFEITDEKKLDIYSWGDYIKSRNKKKSIVQQ